jgi:hypothetical protein
MRHSVLALDLATVTGWAVHSTGMDRPFFGSLNLSGYPAQETGDPCLDLWNFLLEKHRLYDFTHVAFEAQHVGLSQPKKGGPARQINIDTIYKLIGLGTTAEMFAAACRRANKSKFPQCLKVHIGTWRSHFIGNGGLGKVASKQKCIAVCEAFGWDTFDHNAAEACGILDYFLTLLPGEQRPWRDATFFGQRVDR